MNFRQCGISAQLFVFRFEKNYQLEGLFASDALFASSGCRQILARSSSVKKCWPHVASSKCSTLKVPNCRTENNSRRASRWTSTGQPTLASPHSLTPLLHLHWLSKHASFRLDTFANLHTSSGWRANRSGCLNRHIANAQFAVAANLRRSLQKRSRRCEYRF